MQELRCENNEGYDLLDITFFVEEDSTGGIQIDLGTLTDDEITPDAELTICCPMSNTAIVIVIVFEIRSTAKKVLNTHLKKIQVSKFARLLWLMTSWINS